MRSFTVLLAIVCGLAIEQSLTSYLLVDVEENDGKSPPISNPLPEPKPNPINVVTVKPDPNPKSIASSASCCKQKGVPDNCMGLCMDPVYASRSLSRSNACAQFKETIEKCFDGVSKYFKGFPDAAEDRMDKKCKAEGLVKCCLRKKKGLNYEGRRRYAKVCTCEKNCGKSADTGSNLGKPPKCTTPGEEKFDGCNTCTCQQDGYWKCTLRDCIPRSETRFCTANGQATHKNACNSRKCCSGCCGSQVDGNAIRRFCKACD